MNWGYIYIYIFCTRRAQSQDYGIIIATPTYWRPISGPSAHKHTHTHIKITDSRTIRRGRQTEDDDVSQRLTVKLKNIESVCGLFAADVVWRIGGAFVYGGQQLYYFFRNAAPSTLVCHINPINRQLKMLPKRDLREF